MLIERTRTYLSKLENIVFLVLVLILIGIIITSLFRPDSRPQRIRSALTRQGYIVEHVEFELVKDAVRHMEWVFKSSEPIFFDGDFVEYWLFRRGPRSFMWPMTAAFYTVEPYTPESDS